MILSECGDEAEATARLDVMAQVVTILRTNVVSRRPSREAGWIETKTGTIPLHHSSHAPQSHPAVRETHHPRSGHSIAAYVGRRMSGPED